MTKPLPTRISTPVTEVRTFARVQLVVADLDGTLLDPEGNVWEDIRSAVSTVLHRYRVRFTIATGRTFAGAEPLIAKLQLPPRTPVVLYNGSAIGLAGRARVLWKVAIQPESLRHILLVARAWPVNVMAYYWCDEPCDALASRSDVQIGERVIGWSGTGYTPAAEWNGLPVDWTLSADDLPEAGPCAVLIDLQQYGRARRSVLQTLRATPGITVTQSGGNFLEIRPAGSNKWRAVDWVARQLQVPRENILAVGDNENDLEMLSLAGIGVAVKGAAAGVMARADYVCAHDAAGGVLEVLRLIKSARRMAPALRLLEDHPRGPS
jgi:hydroxymethylpyrimidine pyrophosphatase-like HAD family hydrolase